MIFKPHDYQAYCIHRMTTEPVLGLWLDMGLGKTVITLTAVSILKYDYFQVCKTLIIAPKKVAEGTWNREAAKWDHLQQLRFSLVLGSQTKRIRAVNTPADVYIINRENVPWLVDYYRNDWPFDTVVVDESSSFKNRQAKRFKSLCMVRSKISRIYELTGTPSPNGLIDLWAQLFLLDGGVRLGKHIGGFRERYFVPDKRNREQIFSWAAKEGASMAIQEQIGDICISMKAEDYLELPELINHIIPVVLDAKAEKAYRRMEREMLLQVDDQTINAGTAAVLTGKLLQLCNGAVYGDDGQVVPVHDCKLEAFSEVIEQLQGQSALVFYSYQHDLIRILEVLRGTGLRVRQLQTQQDELDWNSGGIDILLAHPASCAYGLNLQDGGHHAIWYGLNWSLELYQQANKRLHRQGQERPVIIHHLVTQGGVDEDVMVALEGKGDTQEALLQALKARIEKIKEAS